MTELLKISLPDGSVREMEPGSSPADVAAAIGPGLAKAAIAARVDGELRDINRPFEGDAELALVTNRDEDDALELARHDFAHVLAEAVQALWPGTQITFGPATEDGFYYDFARDEPFSTEDFETIEARMTEIIERDLIQVLPKKQWIDFSHRMIHHGRRICIARRPNCSECPLLKDCPRVGLPTLDGA